MNLKNTCIVYMIIGSISMLQAQNTETTREFINDLKNREFDKTFLLFNDQVKTMIDTVKLTQFWNALSVQYGGLQSTGELRTEKSGSYEIVYIPCNFKNGTLELKITYNQNGLISGFYFLPPSPKAIYQEPSYASSDSVRELKTEIRTGGYTLPAIITMPREGEDFPLGILVHGSGPNDMDETLNGNKPFRDLALGLAAKGIATLRYDKRTKVYGNRFTDNPEQYTVEDEVIRDAGSAIDLAKNLEGINHKRIFLLGHSLGGMLAPRIADETTGLAGIIILAGNSRKLEVVLLDQLAYLNIISKSENDSVSQTGQLKKETENVKLLTSPSDTIHRPLPLNLPASYWYDLERYDPGKVADSLKIPVLILQGERDYQVTMKDFELWKKELANKKNAFFISYPDLNHLFIEGNGRSTPAEYEKQGNIPFYVIEDIAGWIEKLKP